MAGLNLTYFRVAANQLSIASDEAKIKWVYSSTLIAKKIFQYFSRERKRKTIYDKIRWV